MGPSWRWPWQRERRVGLALAGGGARGLAHLGVLDVLLRNGVEPFCVAGTSAGSVVGAVLAAGVPVSRMLDIASGIRWRQLVRPVTPGHLGLFTLEPMDKILRQTLGGRNTFADLPTPYACMATDVERDELVVLREGPLVPAVRASCSVPGIFTPVQLGDRLLVDGGVMNNLPVKVLYDMGADYVIAVDLLPARAVPRRPRNLFELMTITFYNMVRAASREGDLADVLIVPDIREFSFADFEPGKALVDRGRAAARAALPKIQRDLGLRAMPAAQGEEEQS